MLVNFTAELCSLDNTSVEDPDGWATCTVTGSHFGVHLVNSTVKGNITIFTVHVVGTRTGVVTDGDTVVLNLGLLVFQDFFTLENFASGGLGLVKHSQKVPEAGNRNWLVLCKDLHTEDLWCGVLCSWAVTADNFIETVKGLCHLCVWRWWRKCVEGEGMFVWDNLLRCWGCVGWL